MVFCAHGARVVVHGVWSSSFSTSTAFLFYENYLNFQTAGPCRSSWHISRCIFIYASWAMWHQHIAQVTASCFIENAPNGERSAIDFPSRTSSQLSLHRIALFIYVSVHCVCIRVFFLFLVFGAGVWLFRRNQFRIFIAFFSLNNCNSVCLRQHIVHRKYSVRLVASQHLVALSHQLAQRNDYGRQKNL